MIDENFGMSFVWKLMNFGLCVVFVARLIDYGT